MDGVIVALLLLPVLDLLCLAIPHANAARKKSRGSAQMDRSRIAQQLLRQHNQERAKTNRAPLKLNDRLTAAAQNCAVLLAKKNKFGHGV